mmetsp:Transcript_38949/g.69762  ORF Transcript_38949/g.69762 Transcript_38949/m.69762 type:complete len:208 (-) Transcript_38949:600-1223(-)
MSIPNFSLRLVSRFFRLNSFRSTVFMTSMAALRSLFCSSLSVASSFSQSKAAAGLAGSAFDFAGVTTFLEDAAAFLGGAAAFLGGAAFFGLAAAFAVAFAFFFGGASSSSSSSTSSSSSCSSSSSSSLSSTTFFVAFFPFAAGFAFFAFLATNFSRFRFAAAFFASSFSARLVSRMTSGLCKNSMTFSALSSFPPEPRGMSSVSMIR